MSIAFGSFFIQFEQMSIDVDRSSITLCNKAPLVINSSGVFSFLLLGEAINDPSYPFGDHAVTVV